MFLRTKKTAFSLLEVILAVGLFAIVGTALLTATLTTSFSASNSNDRMVARYLAQEAEEAMRSIRNYDWDGLSAGTHGLTSASSYWEFSGSSDDFVANGKTYTRSIVLTETTAGVRFTAVTTITWTTDDGVDQTYSTTLRLTNIQTASTWEVTSDSDWNQGYLNSVVVASGSVNMGQYADWSNPTSIQINMDGDGDPNEMIVVDNYLYYVSAATAGDEFVIYDISDASENNFTEIAAFDIGYGVNDVAVSGNYAYIATNDDAGEIYVYDIGAVPIAFEQQWDLTGSADATGVAVSGTTLAVSRMLNSSGGEAMFLDISDPTAALSVSDDIEAANSLNDVATHNGYAFYASDGANEFVAVDISDSSVHALDLDTGADGINIDIDEDNDLAYIVRETNSTSEEFHEIDISTPSSPTETSGSAVEFGGTLNDVFVFDGYAYVGTNGGGQEIRVVDLSTDSIVYNIDLEGTGLGQAVWFEGVHLYALSNQNNYEFQVFTTGTDGWSAATHAGSGDPGGAQNAFAVAVDGSYAYLGRQSSGTCDDSTGLYCEFVVYDISTPSSPSLAAALEVGGDVNDIYISGDYAYLATDHNTKEMVIIDISTPTSPSEVGTYDGSGSSNAESILVDGSYAYFGRADGFYACNATTGNDCEFSVVDVSTPSSPSYVTGSGIETDDDIIELAKNGNYVYCGQTTNTEEMVVMDVSTPSSPSEVAQYDDTGNGDYRGLFYDTTNDYLHVARTLYSSGYEYHILSVTGGYSFSSVGGLDYSGGSGDVYVWPAQNLAFLTQGQTNIEFNVIDISTPSIPVSLQTIDLDAFPQMIASDGTNFYLASNHDDEELQVIQEGSVSTTRAQNAIYTTKKYDAGSSVTWGTISWTVSDDTVTSDVQFQIRTASTEAGLDDAIWVGSDGTHSSFYTTSGDSISTHSGASGTQWLQVAVYFTGDGASDNPKLDDLTLTY